MVKHATAREQHGDTGTPLNDIWCSMLQRCFNPNCHAWKWYGGKGVSVCKAWRRYSGFKKWAMANGYKPGLSIDREKASGDYRPSNCSWITRGENARRGSGTKWLVAAFGEVKTIGQWLTDERCKAGKESCIRMRLSRGWSEMNAITTPSRFYGK